MLIEAVRGGHADIVSMLFHLTNDSSSCSSQEENDDEEPEWSSDVQVISFLFRCDKEDV